MSEVIGSDSKAREALATDLAAINLAVELAEKQKATKRAGRGHVSS